MTWLWSCDIDSFKQYNDFNNQPQILPNSWLVNYMGTSGQFIRWTVKLKNFELYWSLLTKNISSHTAHSYSYNTHVHVCKYMQISIIHNYSKCDIFKLHLKTEMKNAGNFFITKQSNVNTTIILKATQNTYHWCYKVVNTLKSVSYKRWLQTCQLPVYRDRALIESDHKTYL